MNFSIFALLLIAGIGAALTSTLAGLASLVSYPALLAFGVPPVIANVTNTAALVFTGIGSAVSSLPELRGRGKFLWRLVLLVSLGSIFGSALLLIAPAATFFKKLCLSSSLPRACYHSSAADYQLKNIVPENLHAP